jgi:hypothetical protein
VQRPAISDISWSEEVSYACACGLSFRAKRVRWVDAEAAPELRDLVEEQGPLQGKCPRCQVDVHGRASWLELFPSRKRATLVLASHQRAELVQELREHLARAAERQSDFETWILTPAWRFAPENEGMRTQSSGRVESTVPRSKSATGTGVPTLMSGEGWMTQRSPDAVRDAWVAPLSIDGGVITLEVKLAEAERKLWGQGALRARPIHLDVFEAPLIGARVIVSYLGQVAVIDGVVNPATNEASEIFALLAQEFRLQLVVRDAERGRVMMRREVASAGLERNAALCLESARQVLADREETPESPLLFQRSLDQLAKLDRKARLVPAARSLAAGAFQHLAMPSEIVRALDELEAISQRDNLRHVLEVDGLPVDEYEAIRKRVLKAAFDAGLCAPPRFWRRAVESGIANSLEEYAATLVRARADLEASDDDDLSLEQAARAWRDIGELVERKGLVLPADAASLLRAHRAAELGSASRHLVDVAPQKSASGEVSRTTRSTDSESQRVRIGGRASSVTINTEVRIPESGPIATDKASPAEKPPRGSGTPLASAPTTPRARASSTRAAGVPLALDAQPTPIRGIRAAPPVPTLTKPASHTRANGPWSPSISGVEERPTPRAQQSAAEAPTFAAPAAKSADSSVEPSASSSSMTLMKVGYAGTPIAGVSLGDAPSRATLQAVAALSGSPLNAEAREKGLRLAFSAWDQGSEADWLALLPAIAPIARFAVPRLLFKLVSPQPASRLSAALLLAQARDPASIAPLSARIFREPSAAWLELARALSFGGERAVAEVCAAFGDATGLAAEDRLLRLSQTLAELAGSESPEGVLARGAVERLRDRAEPEISYAAERAMARLEETREAFRDRMLSPEPGEGADFARQANFALARHTLGTLVN